VEVVRNGLGDAVRFWFLLILRQFAFMSEMTPDEFRRLALSFSEVVESAHMSHPDFRVSGRIFATLGYPDEKWGMIRLTPNEQANFIRADPDMFRPVKGAWGRRGNTNVYLPPAKI